MKILHLCLSCFYIDNSLYQENELVREHVTMGHEVRVIASTEIMSKGGRLAYTEPSEYMGSDGAIVKRLPYRKALPETVMRKLRMHPGVYDEIDAFCPDLIVFHGAAGWELLTARKYVDAHPSVGLIIDSHEDANNSARSLLSREILHKRYYGPILRRALPSQGKILCISLETMDFVHDTYGVPRSQVEFFPLGGRPLDDRKYQERRTARRAALGLQDHHIMFFQSGKFDPLKRLPVSLKAFSANKDPDFRLFLSGVLMDNVDTVAIETMIKADARITFLGWSSPDEMVDLLAATDVYLQPGSQSVTMQNSMCQRCAIVIDDVKSHQPYMNGNGYLTRAGADLEDIFDSLASRKSEIEAMGAQSHKLALDMLDYTKQAAYLISHAGKNQQRSHQRR